MCSCCFLFCVFFFFFKQKTAYEMRISDWSSDVCSSDLGKTLGVIGCGNIGAIVADRAQGLKMHVIAYDPFLSPDRARDLDVEKVELDALLARADEIGRASCRERVCQYV